MPFKMIVKVAKVFGISPSELISIGVNKNDLQKENQELKNIIAEKEKEIISLQKRIIELLEKKKCNKLIKDLKKNVLDS